MSVLYLITGAMAAGKSTTAQALAERLQRSVHLRGDVFRKMIVNGRAPLEPVLTDEARAQLTLRQNIAMSSARAYLSAGFDVVYQDVIVADDLKRVANELRDLEPRIVVLAPGPETLGKRDAARPHKTGYGPDFPPVALASAVKHETPSLGLWLDTSHLTIEETVDAILNHDW